MSAVVHNKQVIRKAGFK